MRVLDSLEMLEEPFVLFSVYNNVHAPSVNYSLDSRFE